LDVIGLIFTHSGHSGVMSMSCLSKWWYNLGSSELVWREQCFFIYDARKKQAESHQQAIAGAQSFTEQKGPLSWRKFWQALKSNAHFMACSNCRKYPIMNVRYECIICEKYCLCVECEAKSVHPKSHILAKMSYAVSVKMYFRYIGTKNHQVTCGKCNATNFEGIRYNNWTTAEILCSECYVKSPSIVWTAQIYPDATLHKQEDLGKNHRGATCDICSARSVPINWKCTCCYDYDLCSHCEEGKRHKKKHAFLKLYWARWNWRENQWTYEKIATRFKDDVMADNSDYEEI